MPRKLLEGAAPSAVVRPAGNTSDMAEPSPWLARLQDLGDDLLDVPVYDVARDLYNVLQVFVGAGSDFSKSQNELAPPGSANTAEYIEGGYRSYWASVVSATNRVNYLYALVTFMLPDEEKKEGRDYAKLLRAARTVRDHQELWDRALDSADDYHELNVNISPVVKLIDNMGLVRPDPGLAYKSGF